MITLENELIQFWIEDGICYSKYKYPIIITVENAKKIIALRHQISNNTKQYWCHDFSNVKSYSKEALAHVEIHGQDFLHGCATITNSHVAMFIFNSFALFKKKRIPLKAFTTREKAVAWLKELKLKNKS